MLITSEIHRRVRTGLRLMTGIVFAGIVCGSALLLAQTVGGTITGTIKDPQGSIMAGAIINLTNAETGIGNSQLSNTSGIYRAANLQPGHYDLKVTSPGFAIALQNGVNLNVGAEVVVDFTMKVADVAGSVNVTGQVAAVDTATSSLTYDVSGTTIRELPLNGRDYTSLAALQPGVASLGTIGGIRAGLGNKLSISGTRPSTNNFLFDGISIMDSGNNTPGSVLGVTLGVDAVEQFTVLTDTFSAEYGRAAGGVVNAITRAGTNELHGSGFYFGRNSALDARNYFDAGNQPKPEFRRHQYGGTAGGPLKKDKTFWFADYEGIQQALGTTTISTVPSPALRQGKYVNGNGSITQYQVDPNIARVLALYPLPNSGLIGNGNTGQYAAVLNSLAREKYVLGKIDHTISAKDSLHGSYFWDSGNTSSPDAFLNQVSGSTSARQGSSIEYTRVISPTVLNVARVGVSRTVFTSGEVTKVLNPKINDTSLGFVPGLDVGGITVSGLTSLQAGPNALDYSFANWTSFQFYENLYITKGTHALKFGFNAERMRYNSSQPNLTGGSWSYGSLPGFITNGLQGTNPAITFSATFLGTDDERGMRQSLYGGYVQDDWKVSSRLTLNLGMRYEIATIPTESQNRIALLRSLSDSAPSLGKAIDTRNPTLRDFSPRVGLAWNPFGDGKTSIRAGFGIFDNLPLLYLYDTPLFRSFPYFTQGVLTNVTAPGLYGAFPSGGYALFSNGQLRTAYVDPAPPRSYTMQWNFNIQRQIKAWTLTTGYVGSRGVHLVEVERNMNVVQPISTPLGYFYPPTSTTQKLNPNFATINTTDTWNADSHYEALHVSMARPLTRGLQVQGSYAWAKSIDDSSSTSSVTAGTGYPNAIGNPDPLIPQINKGLSDFDIRHNATVSLVYDVPGWNSSVRALRMLTGGWESGAIFHIQSGTPFTVVLSADQVGETKADTTGGALGERPNLINSPECKTLTNPGNITNYVKTNCFAYPTPVTWNGITGTVLGNLARNSLEAPGLTNLDFSLIKNDKFHERFTTQFRFEFFNGLNHPNFAAPPYSVFDGNGNLVSNVGRITSTSNQARQIQFGLKVRF